MGLVAEGIVSRDQLPASNQFPLPRLIQLSKFVCAVAISLPSQSQMNAVQKMVQRDWNFGQVRNDILSCSVNFWYRDRSVPKRSSPELLPLFTAKRAGERNNPFGRPDGVCNAYAYNTRREYCDEIPQPSGKRNENYGIRAKNSGILRRRRRIPPP